jgi:protein TonB
MRQLAPILLVTLLITGCASPGSKDAEPMPDPGKPDAVKPATAKPAKRPKTSVPETKIKPPAGEQSQPPEASVAEVKKPQDDQWQPIVVVAANYPKKALDNGTEGYVILEYTVTKTGSLKDIVVIDSTPPGYFEWAAIEAASKFRYNPKLVNGEPVEVPRAQYKMIFKLEYLLPQ